NRLRDEATIAANESIVHLFPRVMFVLMPAFGALTWVFYHRRRHHYAAHLYYSIHFHAFAFLALTVFIVMRALPDLGSMVLMPFIGVAIYHYKSLPTVFAGSRWWMVWERDDRMGRLLRDGRRLRAWARHLVGAQAALSLAGPPNQRRDVRRLAV